MRAGAMPRAIHDMLLILLLSAAMVQMAMLRHFAELVDLYLTRALISRLRDDVAALRVDTRATRALRHMARLRCFHAAKSDYGYC
jgi:hypothetical protein